MKYYKSLMFALIFFSFVKLMMTYGYVCTTTAEKSIKEKADAVKREIRDVSTHQCKNKLAECGQTEQPFSTQLVRKTSQNHSPIKHSKSEK